MNTALLHMLQVSDSVFPIGAFTLSNGLETFVQENKLQNSKHLQEYLHNFMSFMPYNDLGFFAHIYHASYDAYGLIIPEILDNLDALCTAYKSPMEVRKGSQKLCQRFLKAWEKIEDVPNITLYKERIKLGLCLGHHVLALGLFVKSKGLSFEDGAAMYAYSTLSGMVTNAVKSVPLSQLEGQKVLNEALQYIPHLVQHAKDVQEMELGIGGCGFDICAMRHEELYSRLYMS